MVNNEAGAANLLEGTLKKSRGRPKKTDVSMIESPEDQQPQVSH